MKIARLELIEVKIPFRFTFRHALAARSEGHGILVRVTATDGRIGFGECVPRSYVTGETIESVRETLTTHLARPWIGRQFGSFEQVVGAITEGLDADLVALSGDPLEFTTAVQWVMVDGVVQYKQAGK